MHTLILRIVNPQKMSKIQKNKNKKKKKKKNMEQYKCQGGAAKCYLQSRNGRLEKGGA